MTRDITFTAYPNCFANEGTVMTVPWSEWVEMLTTHAVRGKPEDTNSKAALDTAKNGPCIVLGEIPEGKTRGKKNVTKMHALGVDIEDIPDEKVEAVIESLKGYEFILYTTHKHGSEIAKGFARYRLIMPLAEPIAGDPKKWSVVWSRLNMLVGGINDPSTKDASRLNYLPSTFDLEHARAFHFEGKWISIDDLPSHVKDVSEPVHEKSDSAARTVASKIKAKLRRISNDHHLKKPATALCKGESFAEAGERHDLIREFTWWIAERDRHVPIEALNLLFGPSIKVMQAEDPSTPGLDDVERTYTGAVTRIESDKHDKQRSFQLEHIDEAEYDEDDLERIAGVQGCTVEELRKLWIVQRDTTFYFLQENGHYTQPATMAEARLEANWNLARAPVMLNELTKNGTPRRRVIAELVEDYGQKAHKIIADLRINDSYYVAADRIMYEAVCPRRKLVPTFSPVIDEWLKIMGGRHYNKLLDWLACAPDLNKLLCALYFGGHPGGGKTLFPAGISRIWTTGTATEFEKILDDFNEELTKCPIILGDEAIPKYWKGNPTTTKIRSIISQQSRTLSRKHKAPADLIGAVRLILTANNDQLLSGDGASTHLDLQAIAQRFLYIEVGVDAKDFIESIGDEAVQGILWGDGLAKHALHLEATREVIKDRRFWVEGDTDSMHRMLMTGTAWNSLVCEWLVRYLLNPTVYDQALGSSGWIRRGKGQLLVCEQGIIDGWKTYINLNKDPETAKIGTALRAISATRKPVQKRFMGRRLRYRIIDTAYLFDWSHRYNIGDEEALRCSLDGGNPARMDTDSDETDDIDTIPSMNEKPI